MVQTVPRLGLALIVLVLVAGYTAIGPPVAADPSTQPADAVDSSPTRFDGDANAEVTVYNGRNRTWTIQYTILREDTIVLRTDRTVAPGEMWNVTTIEDPGNYTFRASFDDGPTLEQSVRLPRAVGDRHTFVSIKPDEAEPELLIYWEQ